MSQDLEETAKAVAALLKVVPSSGFRIDNPASSSAKKLRRAIEDLIARLNPIANQLDPIQRPEFVFDPTNPEILGKIIGQTLLEQSRRALGSVTRFYGSGVYALYYRGDFSAYAPIRAAETPIYVGKADPPTPDAKSFIEQGPKLSARIAEHAKSIAVAKSTLQLEDFDCRFLVVQSGWQRSAEDYLLNLFKPVWNSKICFGFGKHGDAAKTRENTRSPWDTLHPGRPWATSSDNKPNPLSPKQIKQQIAEHYRNHPPKR